MANTKKKAKQQKLQKEKHLSTGMWSLEMNEGLCRRFTDS